MNNNFLKSTIFATTALGLGVGIAAPAFAQAADSGENAADIVVTARRVEERLQDVPISITVFNQEQLSRQNVVNASDLATITPSLSANSNFGSENSSFAIRGFVQDIGTQPSVGVYFDDVVAPRGFSNGIVAGDGAGPGAFFDLQNVQVLKGPQGTLFGRNTTGGAVLMVPQRPTDEFGGYLEASAGNFDMAGYQGVLNLPISDNARLRLGIDHQYRQGYVHNTSGIGPQDFNDVHYTTYRASFVANLTPSLENYTVASYTNSNTHGSLQKMVRADAGPFNLFGLIFGTDMAPLAAAQMAVQGSDFYDAQQDLTNPESVLRTWQVINTTTWDLSDNLTFKNIVSYAELTQDLVNPLFGTNMGVDFAYTAPVAGGHSAQQSTFTEEARFEGSNFDDKLTWQGGVYFETSDPLGRAGSSTGILAHCTTLSDPSSCSAPFGDNLGIANETNGQTKAQTTGVYVQGSYAMTDQLKLTLGYRYTWDRITNTSTQFTRYLAAAGGVLSTTCTNPDANVLTCTMTTAVHTEAPTWLIGLDYTPTEDLLFYGKYARGYRSGTVSPNVVAPFMTADAEHVDTYEIGSKWSFHAPVRGILNASLFYNDFTNQQLQFGFVRFDILSTPTAAPINVGASEIWGAELQGSITPLEGLTLSADYTYLHTEVTQSAGLLGTAGPYTVIGAVPLGAPLVLSPENKYTLSAQYRLPLDASVGDVTLGATFIHTDEQVVSYGDLTAPGYEDLGKLPALDLVNLNMTWSSMFGSPVDLTVFGTNVTDEHYYTFVPGIAQVTGFETAVVGQPRMYGVSLRYRFGGEAH